MIYGVYNHFNRGEVDDLALARDDVGILQQSGSHMENFLPETLGPMSYRPGLEFIGWLGPYKAGGYGVWKFIPFTVSSVESALLQFTDNSMRVWVNNTQITREDPVDALVTNGEFTSNLTGWTDDSGAGATTAWETGAAALTGGGTTSAVLYQEYLSNMDAGIGYALRIVITQAPVRVQIGTAGARSGDIFDGVLGVGTHSLYMIGVEEISITLINDKKYKARVESVMFEAAGALELPTAVPEEDVGKIRYAQSGGIMYIAYGGAQFKVERRSTYSWSVVDYRVDDGPFGLINDTSITITPGALSGDTTLTSSEAYFTTGHVGKLFKLSSAGQLRTGTFTAAAQTSSSIRVTGAAAPDRTFYVTLSGTWSGSIILERSADNATWSKYITFSSNVNHYGINDTLYNSILYYRLKCDSLASGTVNYELDYSGGGVDGICRVTGYTDSTHVNAQILVEFGAVEATFDWYESEWDATLGYPTACVLGDGRLWWAGSGKFWGSVSDSYESMDSTIEGDSAAIRRTIGFGGSVDNVEWMAAATRITVGMSSGEVVLKSNSLGDVITNTNVNLSGGSTIGSASVLPVVIDDAVYFTQRYKRRLYQLIYDSVSDGQMSEDLTKKNPGILDSDIVSIAVSRYPYTRIWVVLSDGGCRVFTLDRNEEIASWSRLSSGDDFLDVAVVPGESNDDVYFVVTRGQAGAYLERLAPASECIGGSSSKHFDSFVSYTSPAAGLLDGLDHLEGQTVGVWVDGEDKGDYVVTNGYIEGELSWTDIVVGLRYTASWISNKLGGFTKGSVLGLTKRIVNTALVTTYLYPGKVKVGSSASTLYDLPLIEDGTSVDQTPVLSSYHEVPFEYDGEDEIDPRIYIQATGPCMIQALIFGVKGQPSKSSVND